MGSSAPQSTPIGASPRQSSLDIKRAQNEARENLLNRTGFRASKKAGETGKFPASGVLG